MSNRPIPTDEQVALLRLSAARAELLENIMNTHPAEIPSSDQHHAPRRRRPIFQTVALVGLVAAAAVTFVALAPQEKTRPQNAAAPAYTSVSQVIDAATASEDPVDPTSAPYWKVVERTSCRKASERCEVTTWVGNDGPGATRYPSGIVQMTCPSSIGIDGRRLSWNEVNARTWSDAQIATMTADRMAVAKPDRAPSAFFVFKNTTELLATAPASTTIRRQLWDQLRTLSGVRLDGRDRDELGRPGWRLTLDAPRPGSASQSVLVDTQTGTLLERSDTPPDRSANVSTIISASPASSAPGESTGDAGSEPLVPLCG